MRLFGLALMILGVLGLLIWWQIYKYSDCRMVGHSNLYCILDIGH